MIRKNQNGIALFIVLWVLTLLSVMVAEFAFATRTTVNMVRNFKEGTQAYYLARSGVNMAVADLMADQLEPGRRNSTDGEITQQVEFQPLSQNLASFVTFADGGARIWVQSLSGKVNLNRAGRPLLLAMLRSFDLDEKKAATIVDSILDWRDTDNLHRVNGAENAYYQSLSEPYSTKNGDFDAPGELLRVRGITPELYFGGLADMVTVFPKNKSETNSESGDEKKSPYADVDFNKIDLNNIDRTLLTALPGMTGEAVNAVLEKRRGGRFKNVEELRSLLGAEIFDEAIPFLTFSDIPVYRILVAGELPDTRVRRSIEAVVEFNLTAKIPLRFLRWREVPFLG